jgi:hypothetical protein
MARKLACLFCRLIKQDRRYVDKGMKYYGARYPEQQGRSLMKRAPKARFSISYPKDRLRVSGERARRGLVRQAETGRHGLPVTDTQAWAKRLRSI